MDVQETEVSAQAFASTRQRMLAGQWFHSPSLDLTRLHLRAQGLIQRFNQASPSAYDERQALLAQLLGRFGQGSWIEPGLQCDYGAHIEIGDDVYINVNCTLLDGNRIEIGDRVYVSPNVQMITTRHPVHPAQRTVEVEGERKCVLRADPIRVGNDVWIGAGAILLGGVEVGEGSVIGAGSVVTRSIAPGVVAAGNPCRVIRSAYE
ncbi:acetyltransferase (isoleucine patch superfamily) [Pseudomonas asplenii]|uniref:Nodulation protein L n=1 Tax=Pseudomonas asplenii TaxID=53407 RepID=A0A0M9GIL4_9PSED|nr:sugar O-acetyltransferase [Pseudomonas fuscovaginae]KPA92122.1 acetyltransferase (isoleucine patch superfamily) [Pseudomonas fuscovaginae]